MLDANNFVFTLSPLKAIVGVSDFSRSPRSCLITLPNAQQAEAKRHVSGISQPINPRAAEGSAFVLTLYCWATTSFGKST
jgi:hypothetical protein